jgi:plasmid stabilization system protein ParE
MMQVEITRFARLQLKQIYAWYKIKASEKIALKIIDKILDSIEELGNLPGIGSIEPHLAHIPGQYKYIGCGNCKIIFRIANNIVFVTDIFDCRQNPRKIIKRST